MSSWKKRMYAEMERETALEMAKSDPDYACYRQGLEQDALKKVLDFHQKKPQDAKLPNKEGLIQEIRRWNTQVDDSKLKRAKRDELIQMLCQSIGHTPRQWVSAKQYHRFGLSFKYKGKFPSIKYSEDLSTEELRAMLELYTNPQISVAQLKAALKKHAWRPKVTGNKGELLQRLHDAMGCKDLNHRYTSKYTLVGCWKDEHDVLQSLFNEERDEWLAEIQASKENAVLFAKSKNDRKALEDEKAAKKQQAIAVANSRPWKASYDPKAKSKAEYEAEWKQRHPRLSFPYSGAILPPPDAFHAVFSDYKTNPNNAHHLLAYLEKGYGTFNIIRGEGHHAYMDKASLNTIHGRPCRSLGASHQLAVQVLRHRVQNGAYIRFTQGL